MRRIAFALIFLMTLLQLGAAGFAHVDRLRSADLLATEEERARVIRRAVERAREDALVARGVAEPSWHLSDGPDVPATLQELQKMADDNGVKLDGMSASDSATPGRQTFAVTGTGEPAAVCGFLAAIEQTRRLIVVESGAVMPGDNVQTLAFDFGISTWHNGEGQ